MARPKTRTAPCARLAIRLEPELVAMLDAAARTLARLNPGLTVTRSAAMRALVIRGMAELDAEAKALANTEEA